MSNLGVTSRRGESWLIARATLARKALIGGVLPGKGGAKGRVASVGVDSWSDLWATLHGLFSTAFMTIGGVLRTGEDDLSVLRPPLHLKWNLGKSGEIRGNPGKSDGIQRSCWCSRHCGRLTS